MVKAIGRRTDLDDGLYSGGHHASRSLALRMEAVDRAAVTGEARASTYQLKALRAEVDNAVPGGFTTSTLCLADCLRKS